jgi:hypothetical protein
LGGLRVEVSLGKQFVRPHLQNNQSKMDLRYDSSHREPALEGQNPEFKTQSQPKKKKKKERNIN